jgi:hypothetical protein
MSTVRFSAELVRASVFDHSTTEGIDSLTWEESLDGFIL